MSFLRRLFKSAYRKVPLKQTAYTVLSRIVKLPKRIYQHLHFEGFFEVEAAPGRSFQVYHHGAIEENEIFWNGLYNGWERQSMVLWSQLVPEAKVILDVGANTGIYGLVAETINPKASVHCFEPIRGVFKILQNNFRRNHFRAKLYEFGLSNYTGYAKIYLAKGDDFAYSVTVNKNTLTVEADEITIRVKTLRDFISAAKLQSIDLMKIDVESHEPEVLEGMGRYLEAFQPTILIEVLDEVSGKKLTDMFAGMGYLYFNIDDNRGTVRQTTVITKSDNWNYLVCKPDVARRLRII